MCYSGSHSTHTHDIMRLSWILIFFTIHFLRTFFSAAQSVPSFIAGLRAIGALPTPSADTTSGRGITRTIVHAFTMRVAILAVKTLWALCFASYPCFDVKKKTRLEKRFFAIKAVFFLCYFTASFVLCINYY